MRSSVFNLSFQIAIFHPIMSNNCDYFFLPVLPLYSVAPRVVLEKEQPYIASLTPGIISKKQINIGTIKWRYISTKRSWSHKKYKNFDSSSTTNIVRARLPFGLSFRSSWLCSKTYDTTKQVHPGSLGPGTRFPGSYATESF